MISNAATAHAFSVKDILCRMSRMIHSGLMRLRFPSTGRLTGCVPFLLLSFILVTTDVSGASSSPQIPGEVDPFSSRGSWRLIAQKDVPPEELLMAVRAEGEEDQEALMELLTVLEEETEAATKTKMNKDYVPGMVTVLHGEHLEALGIQTVAEALSMVPGIQVSRVSAGEPSVKVRGLSYPFNAGNIKIMLNSVALSRESSGINSSVLLTPVAQVERIEVVRGPGAIIYGDFAMAGVVNIITRNTGRRVFGRIGNNDSRGGGGHYAYQDDRNSLGVGVNVSMIDDGKGAAALGKNPEEDRFTGIFNFNYKGFTLTAQGVRRDAEYYYLLPLPADIGVPGPGSGMGPGTGSGPVRVRSWGSQTEEAMAIEGRQSIEFDENMDLEAYISFLQNEWASEAMGSAFNGDRIATGVDLRWSPWSGHQVLFGASYTDSDIDSAGTRPPGDLSTEVSGIGRRNYSLSMQDQVALGEHFSLTLGVRYDDYDDVGSLLSPRLAGVCRIGDSHIIKAQYSEGFRSPTFWELYPTGSADESLDFEVIRTTELAYVYRLPRSAGRITLYSSEINDGLYYNTEGNYSNCVDIRSKGVEVEWEQQLGETFRWLANISYVDTWDGRYVDTHDHESPGIAEWLGNLAFFLQPLPKVMVTGRLLYVGDRPASEGMFDGYTSVDFTVSRIDFLKPGLTLRIGIKNAFDDQIVYLNQGAAEAFKDDYSGRTLWMQVSYDF